MKSVLWKAKAKAREVKSQLKAMIAMLKEYGIEYPSTIWWYGSASEDSKGIAAGPFKLESDVRAWFKERGYKDIKVWSR